MKIRTTGAPAPLVLSLSDGASLTLRPWASGALIAARTAYAQALRDGASKADADVAFTAGAAAWGVTAWSGFFDADDTSEDPAPLVLSEELVIAAVTQRSDIMDAVDRQFLLPGLNQEAEKNGSASAPGGAGRAQDQTTAN